MHVMVDVRWSMSPMLWDGTMCLPRLVSYFFGRSTAARLARKRVCGILWSTKSAVLYPPNHFLVLVLLERQVGTLEVA